MPYGILCSNGFHNISLYNLEFYVMYYTQNFLQTLNSELYTMYILIILCVLPNNHIKIDVFML